MRKPIAAAAVAFGLWLAPAALAGENSAVRESARRTATRIEIQIVTSRSGAETRIDWVRKAIELFESVAPVGPIYSTQGIIDEPDPTSAKDKARRRGIGHAPPGGGSSAPPPDPILDDPVATPTSTVSMKAPLK
jgi:hypothetical protein